MPNGFWYASGPKEMAERKPGSAFSKGDMLALDANSSLSRLNPYAATAAGSLYAIATADSIDSIRDLVPVIVVQPTTRFWSATTGLGVAVISTGTESGVSFDAAKPGRYWVDGSTATDVVVVVQGSREIDQSVQSRVLVQFKFADSELDFA